MFLLKFWNDKQVLTQVLMQVLRTSYSKQSEFFGASHSTSNCHDNLGCTWAFLLETHYLRDDVEAK